MQPFTPTPLVLQNRHTGERLELRRLARGDADADVLALAGRIPAGRPSMSVHEHHSQHIRIEVRSGVLHALVGGRHATIPAGQTLDLPPGTPYRLWNEEREDAIWEGEATPAGDLDRYLQAYMQVVNSGEPNRPPLTYLARVQLRHQNTQSVKLLWGPSQSLLFMAAALFGGLTGRFRGTEWPGAPERCPGALTEASPEALATP